MLQRRIIISFLLNAICAQLKVNLNDTNSVKNRTRYDSRIINGSEVTPPFKYSFMVSVRRNGGSYCGGVLLSETYMLTAAHCSKSGNNEEFRILAHRHNLKLSKQMEEGFSLTVKRRIVHKEHDIALWELNKDTEFHMENQIELAPLNANNEVSDESKNKIVTALGWGWIKTGGPGSHILMQVDVPLIEQDKCVKLWHRRGVDINKNTQVCAGWPEGRKDTCKGDSGGPLFYTQNNKYYLVGLTSFGEPCAKANTPTVYVRASYFEKWIEKHSKLNLQDDSTNVHTDSSNGITTIGEKDITNTQTEQATNSTVQLHTPIARLMSRVDL